MSKKIVRTLIGFEEELKFGDFILFQNYNNVGIENGQIKYEVDKPAFGIYIEEISTKGSIGFEFIRWRNNNRNNEIREKFVESYIEWEDFVDILGHWNHRPSWKEMLKAYRKQNTEKITFSGQITTGKNQMD